MEKKLTVKESLRKTLEGFLGDDDIGTVESIVDELELFLENYLNIYLSEKEEEREKIREIKTQEAWSYMVRELPSDPVLRFDIFISITEYFLNVYSSSLPFGYQKEIRNRLKKIIEGGFEELNEWE